MLQYCFIMVRIACILLQDLIDVLDGGAAAFCDAFAAFAVDDVVVPGVPGWSWS